jgi:hypothetical protein
MVKGRLERLKIKVIVAIDRGKIENHTRQEICYLFDLRKLVLGKIKNSDIFHNILFNIASSLFLYRQSAA